MGDCCVPSWVLAVVLPVASPDGEMVEDLTVGSRLAQLSLIGLSTPPAPISFASAFKGEGIASWSTSGPVPGSGDGVLKEHLETAPQVATYLGARSQNEMISIVGDAVRQEVIRRVKEAGKFCILMDETQDSSHTDQVSVFVRFVGLEGEHPCVQERLLALVPAECKTGEALETLLIATLEKNGLSLEDIVGQCYDGGSNMAGTYKGVQARILQKNPLALFTHCHSHNLNRVVVNSCNHKTLPEARIFFFHCWKA